MLLYDSIRAANIPKTAQAVAGYDDGAYAWSQADYDSFPQAVIKRHITVGYLRGDTVDIERFNAQPSFAGPYIVNRLNAGIVDPWTYCDRNDQHACEDSMFAAGVPITKARMWIATLDGTQSVAQYRYPIAAVQFANSVISGGPYDESVFSSVVGPVLSDSDLDVIHDRIQFADWGVIDKSPQSYADFRFAVGQRGTSVASIDANWKLNPQAAVWQAELAKLGAPPLPPEPYMVVRYDFTDGTLPLTETVRLSDAVAFAKEYEATHPGTIVTISPQPVQE